MKIAVLGSNGFVGRNLVNYLSNHFKVFPVTRKSLNLLNPQAVKDFLTFNYFDAIVNCATIMTDDSSVNDTYNNLGIFMNFYSNANKFGKFINTASGAEFDRSRDINCVNEDEIFNILPQDSYGFGQNIKARLCVQTKDFYNIRIFNCFGSGELSTRLFPRLINQKTLDISNDRYFDYFSIQDLQLVIQNCIINDWQVKDVNAVYENKITISEAAKQFVKFQNLSTKINVISSSKNNYTGSGKSLKSLSIKLNGLEQGFKDYRP